MIGTGEAAFDYGNARVRARRSRLLSAGAVQDLVGRDLDELLSTLGQGPWRPDVEEALTRYTGLRVLYEAARRHLARTLREVRSFYPGEAGRSLDLYLARYDTDNVIAILRGQARGADPDEVVPLVVPAGRIDEATFVALAHEPGLRPTIDRLVAWGLPSAAAATALLRIRPEHEGLGDPTALEQTLLRVRAEEVDRTLEEGLGGEELARVLRRRIDRDNLLATLRLWGTQPAAERAGVQLRRHLLPGGKVDRATLQEAFDRADAADLARQLAPHLPPRWRDPVGAWGATSDLYALADELDRALLEASLARFVHGDPLGLGIPLAFFAAIEAEAHNVRILGRGTVLDLPRDVVISRLRPV